MATSRAYRVQLGKGGTKVVLAELGIGDVKKAMQLASGTTGDEARALETAMQGLRLSIRQVNDRPVKYSDLQGQLLEDLFSVKELLMLSKQWNIMHMPDAAETDDMLGEAEAISG